MTTIPAVVPSIALGGVGRPAGSTASLRHPPPPLAELGRAGPELCGFGFAVIDNNGRLSDRALVQRLGWVPGTRLHMSERSGSLLVVPHSQGVFTISSQGHVVLPAAVRHTCRLQIHDRVLLVADLAAATLAVHTPGVIQTMLEHLHHGWLGREAR
ncbi:hypothetical protein ACQP00_37660 [Dactylosporangium sp. CS-047395]|uniref:hypothetical protein n=1 Tax=Dactylosporangium sp. CS-047395 TaxID=3239936 RepID=UPI003D8F7587